MENNKLTKKIMKKVIAFEKRRIIVWITRVFLAILILFLTTGSLFWLITRILGETKTLELLELFGEDWEIIQEFWQETLVTFWIELPLREILIFAVCLTLLILVVVLLIKRFPIIRKKILAIKKFSKSSHNKK